MRTANREDLPAIRDLLAASGLPTDDLAEQDLSLFLVQGEGEPLAVVGGLERCGSAALLRSVATAPAHRGRGLARTVVAALEARARSLDLDALYLLTETAADYFQALGYAPLDRADVPGSIRESRQFADLCPDSATVMRKGMGAPDRG
jgi:amino-acid N-acetyltransferase